MDQLLTKRIEELRRRGAPGVAPLWIETLPPDEALEALEGVNAPWAALKRAELLLDEGPDGVALSIMIHELETLEFYWEYVPELFEGNEQVLEDLKAL